MPCYHPVIRLISARAHGMIGPPTMKSVVLLSLLSSVLSWAPQPVQDTPEVAAAKAAHLAALAKAKQEAREKSRPAPQQTWNVEENTIKQEPWKAQWTGNGGVDQWNQIADTVQGEDDGSWKDDGSWQNYDDGSWKDPDVTEAPQVDKKWAAVGEPRWKGPIALPPGYDESGAPLPVEDTPEVAAAKAKHLQAYMRAAAKTAAAPVAPAPPKQQPAAYPVKPRPRTTLPRQLPPAPLVRQALPPLLQVPRTVPKAPAPVWEHDGTTDTPEVAAAKAAHFAAHAKRRL